MSDPMRHSPVFSGPFGAPPPLERHPSCEIWMPERRQFIRSASASPVFISWRRHAIAVTIRDATPSGIRVDVELPQTAVGDVVQVQFAGCASVRGEIRWCRDGRTGVQLPSFERDLLDELRSDYHGSDYLIHVIAWQKLRQTESLLFGKAIDSTDIPHAIANAVLPLVGHEP